MPYINIISQLTVQGVLVAYTVDAAKIVHVPSGKNSAVITLAETSVIFFWAVTGIVREALIRRPPLDTILVPGFVIGFIIWVTPPPWLACVAD